MRETANGLLIKVRALPGAATVRVGGMFRDALKVAVQAPAEGGKANAAVAAALARHFGLRASQVRLHSGSKAREKWFELKGLALAAARGRLS